MSDRRLQWSVSEKELLLRLRLSNSGSTISELKDLFNAEIRFERHRTDEAVKSQLSRLKGKGTDGIENEIPRASSTKETGSTILSSHSSKFAFAAPEFGIYVPLHPLHAGDLFFKDYAKDLANMPEPSKWNFRRG